MSFWLREAFGWVLVIIGLAIFGLVILHLIEGLVYQTMGMTLIGIFVFRGGIHLLKVAVAARICEQTAAHLRVPATPPLVHRTRV